MAIALLFLFFLPFVLVFPALMSNILLCSQEVNTMFSCLMRKQFTFHFIQNPNSPCLEFGTTSSCNFTNHDCLEFFITMMRNQCPNLLVVMSSSSIISFCFETSFYDQSGSSPLLMTLPFHFCVADHSAAIFVSRDALLNKKNYLQLMARNTKKKILPPQLAKN